MLQSVLRKPLWGEDIKAEMGMPKALCVKELSILWLERQSDEGTEGEKEGRAAGGRSFRGFVDQSMQFTILP